MEHRDDESIRVKKIVEKRKKKRHHLQLSLKGQKEAEEWT